jgi:hypothetical protein
LGSSPVGFKRFGCKHAGVTGRLFVCCRLVRCARFSLPLMALRPACAQPAGAAPGTNIAVSVCHGAPASLSPSPRAWPAALGAVDMPIDCASTFLRLRIQARGTVSALGQSLQKTAKAGTSPAIAQQQKYDL